MSDCALLVACIILSVSIQPIHARTARRATRHPLNTLYHAGKWTEMEAATKSGSLSLARLLLECKPTLAWCHFHTRQSHSLRSAHTRSCSPPVLSVAAKEASGKATVSESIINLAKSACGCGMIALPAGVAAFSASPTGVLPALMVVLCFGSMSAYTFTLIGRVCNEVGSVTYASAWAKLFGNRSSILVAFANIFMQAVTVLSYSIILGDGFASIASLMGLRELLCAPNTWIFGLSAFLLLPLALARNLKSMAVGSMIGTVGSLYTALFMLLRLADQSYAAGGKFHTMIAESARPLFFSHTAANPLINPAIFVLISMLSLGFCEHTSAPMFFRELAQPTDGSSKAKAFVKVVAGGFIISVFLFASVMAGGYLTFGGNAQGFILNSYATADPLALLARIATCASLVFGYPIQFKILRDGLLEMFRLDEKKNAVHVISTVALLCTLSGISLVLKDLGIIVAIGGALAGSALAYTFPALMFIQSTRSRRKELQAEGGNLPGSRLKEMYANYGFVGAGVAIGALGLQMSLKGLA